MIQQGIVETISERHVGRLLQEAEELELMVAFYQYYLASGNKAIALQLAMQKVRSIPEYSNPRYWATFAMVDAEV